MVSIALPRRSRSTKRGGPSTVIRVGIAVAILALWFLLVGFWCWVAFYHETNPATTISNSAVPSDWKHPTAPVIPVSVFYHIYIPPNKGREGFRNAQFILKEQLTQLRRAAETWSHQHPRAPPWKVYFTTTGTNSTPNARISSSLAVTHEWIQTQACGPHTFFLSCQPTGSHWDVGYEEITLRALHDHCQASTSPDISPPNELVIYLHSKGSYHGGHGRNHDWRRALTQAATHASCLESLWVPGGTHVHTRPTTNNSNNQNGRTLQPLCNVCGLQFVPLWAPMYPGNMFATTCEYVSQLLDPQTEFPQALQTVIAQVNASHTMVADLYNFDNPSNLGLGRYAAEQWIASHPHVRPCDVQHGTPRESTLVLERLVPAPEPNLDSSHQYWWFFGNSRGDTTSTTRYLEEFLSNTTHALVSIPARTAPRIPIEQGDWFRLEPAKLQSTLQQQQSSQSQSVTQPPLEYFLLPGLLYRHLQLYGQLAPRDSWIWTWYPQGPEWRDFLDTSQSPMALARNVLGLAPGMPPVQS